MSIRGIRGATTVSMNDASAILEATQELLLDIQESNSGLKAEDVVSALFTLTPDLNAAYPAKAARELGWMNVPLICAQEIPVPEGLTHCIRVLLHWNTDLPQNAIQHSYLRKAVALRPDLLSQKAEGFHMTSEPDFTKCNVAIWGLGLMGGSLALALAGKCVSLIGIDPDPRAIELADESNVFDHISEKPEGSIHKADLIILAAPVRAILAQIVALPDLHPGPCVVLDIGSTKQQIIKAMADLPHRFDPVGGHPMCGNEHSSFQHAEASLFSDSNFALVKLPRTSSSACTVVDNIARLCGANPLWLDAETHDKWTAMTSHMPYLIANALTASIPTEASPLAGSGLRSTTRIASSSPAMMKDVLMTNKDLLLDALKIFQGNLQKLEDDIRHGDHTTLERKLRTSCNARNALFSKGNT